MSFLSTYAAVLSGQPLRVPSIDPDLDREKNLVHLYQQQMHFLELTGNADLDRRNPNKNDPLLMHIVVALWFESQYQPPPVGLAFECLEARVRENYEEIAQQQ